MKCVNTVSYSCNVNGELKKYISPSRGIRQGDPLSPYLFLICFEAFSNLLKRADQERTIKGLKISRRGPTLTHLLFTDDSLVFCKAGTTEARKLMELLHRYESTSGQLVNLEKSSAFFSSSVWILEFFKN